jgi:hypothetical protein
MRVLVVALVAVLGSSAGPGGRAEEAVAPAPDAAIRRGYDPATVETLDGEVTRVSKVAFKHERGYGVQLMLRTAKELVLVRLGPGSWVERQQVEIDPGDTIAVKGSRVTRGQKPAIVAAEVRKGDRVLRLRDDRGTPLWRKRRGA